MKNKHYIAFLNEGLQISERGILMAHLTAPESNEMSMQKSTLPKAKVVCILGMHRSGTSTVSRSINLLGVYLGEDADLALISRVDNPEGFWERYDMIGLHDKLLSALSLRWDTTLPLPAGWQKMEAVEPFREELRQLVPKVFAGKLLWGWKDPRTCLFLDLWKDVLSELGMELCILYVVRHPSDVANSLMKRDGHSIGKAYGIWFNYNLAALKSILGIHTFFVSYDKLLDDGAVELQRCAEGLKINWPEDDSDLQTELSGFLRKDLRHSKSIGKNLPSSVAELYDLLVTAIKSPEVVNDNEFLDKVETLFLHHSEFSEFVREDMVKAFVLEQPVPRKKLKTFFRILNKIKLLASNSATSG